MRRCIVIGVVGILLGSKAAAFAGPPYEAIPGVREFTRQLIAKPLVASDWQARGDSQAVGQAREAAARNAVAKLPLREHVDATDEYVVFVPAGQDENSVSAQLLASGNFVYVEPNWRVFPLSCPDDPLVATQWHHNANRMQSCDAWGLFTGSPSVTVAICDTGIRVTHQDLLENRREGYNAVDRLWESQGGDISPIHGHGTNTTGCAAANGQNGAGVAGVGLYTSHRMMRVSNLPNGDAYLSDLQHAARTAIENGDKVASVSYSGVDTSSNLTTAAYIKSLGGLLVWAAGNDSRNLTMNNRDADDLIVAGGTSSSDALANFSAYGVFVDVVAPAVNVYTTDSDGDYSYASVSGTSFACPLTAGLCALLFAADPSATPDDVETWLKAGAEDLGAPGVDNTYAYGRINSYLSLQAQRNNCASGTISQQPASSDGCVGDPLHLSVASNIPSPSYQWRRNGLPLVDGGHISGAHAATLALDPLKATDAGDYDCIITNGATGCPTLSATAFVTVDPCGRMNSLERVNTVPTSGADLANFHRNSTHFTFDLVVDAAFLESDWTASEILLDVLNPGLGRIWHASDETNFGDPLGNLNVPLLADTSTSTRVFDTFLSPPLSPFFTAATLASPGGVISTATKVRGVSGQGGEIPLAWFDTIQTAGGQTFVGARITFELFTPGNLTTSPGGTLFATLSGRSSTALVPGGDDFSFSIYRSDPINCPADLNGDQTIDLLDLSILLTHFGTQSGATPDDGDLDGDGDVDLLDLSELLIVFGGGC